MKRDCDYHVPNCNLPANYHCDKCNSYFCYVTTIEKEMKVDYYDNVTKGCIHGVCGGCSIYFHPEDLKKCTVCEEDFCSLCIGSCPGYMEEGCETNSLICVHCEKVSKTCDDCNDQYECVDCGENDEHPVFLKCCGDYYCRDDAPKQFKKVQPKRRRICNICDMGPSGCDFELWRCRNCGTFICNKCRKKERHIKK